ncbi:MAG: galactose oxidase [Candidatus Brocadiia bacterium]
MRLAARAAAWTLLAALAGCSALGLQPRPPIEWTRLPDLRVPLGGQFAGVSGGALVVAGGAHFPVPMFEGGKKQWVDTVYALEPGAALWQEVGSLEGPLAYGASVTTADGILLIGGCNAERCLDRVVRLRYAGGQVEQTALPNLPKPCAYTSAARMGSTVYVAGGQDLPRPVAALKNFWALDLDQPEPQWQELEPWPGPGRVLPVAGVADGAFYLFGGCKLKTDQAGRRWREYLADAYRYRPGEGWEPIADLPRPMAGAPSPAPVLGRELVVLGGDDGANALKVWQLRDRHPGFRHEVLAYDPAADQWRVLQDLPAALVTTTAVAWQGGIVVPGGEDRPGHRSATVLFGRPTAQK